MTFTEVAIADGFPVHGNGSTHCSSATVPKDKCHLKVVQMAAFRKSTLELWESLGSVAFLSACVANSKS